MDMEPMQSASDPFSAAIKSHARTGGDAVHLTRHGMMWLTIMNTARINQPPVRSALGS